MPRRLVVLVAVVLTAGLGLTAPAHAAEDPCLKAPVVGEQPYNVARVLTDKPLLMPIAVVVPDASIDCTGLTASVQKYDGTLATTVALDKDGVTGTPEPPVFSKYGSWTIPVAKGGGSWIVTKVTHGANSLVVNLPFTIHHGATITLEQPVRTSGTARTTITGLRRRWDGTGSLVPSIGSNVEIGHTPGKPLIGTVKTDSTGRFRLSVLFTQNTSVRATFVDPLPSYYVESADLTVHKLLAMSYLTAAKTAKVNTLWKVSGTAFPGKLWTNLQIWNGKTWLDAGSAGYTAVDGSYARYWKASRAGAFRLRVVVSGVRLDNSPWHREATVTVR